MVDELTQVSFVILFRCGRQMLGVRMKRATLCTKKEGIPVNSPKNPQGDEGKTSQCPSQIAGRDRFSMQIEACPEEDLSVLTVRHLDRKALSWQGKPPGVVDLHADEGRHVKLLPEIVFGRRGAFGLSLPLEGAGIALVPGGVGDLDQKGLGQEGLRVPTIIKAYRIEAVPEITHVGKDGNPPFWKVSQLLVDRPPNGILQGFFRVSVIIVSIEPCQVPTIRRPKQPAFEHLGELVEKKVNHE